jgi:hypothetical protein
MENPGFPVLPRAGGPSTRRSLPVSLLAPLAKVPFFLLLEGGSGARDRRATRVDPHLSLLPAPAAGGEARRRGQIQRVP